MSLSQIIRTIFELALVVFAIWSVFHEDLFIAIEERIASGFKRRKLKIITGSSYYVLK